MGIRLVIPRCCFCVTFSSGSCFSSNLVQVDQGTRLLFKRGHRAWMASSSLSPILRVYTIAPSFVTPSRFLRGGAGPSRVT